MKKINLITLVLLFIFTSQFLNSCSNQAVYTQNDSSFCADSRSDNCIQLVIQKNKGKIYTIYNIALRKNPELHGEIVFNIHLTTTGVVDKITVIKNETNSKALAQKIMSAFKSFNFSDGLEHNFTYPLVLIPS